MKKQIDILRSDLQPGDVTITANPGNNFITVERDIPEPQDNYEPGTWLKVHMAYADYTVYAFKDLYAEDDSKPWLVLFNDGSNGHYPFDEFKVIPEEKPAPTKPAITRDHFIATINSVVEQNGLVVGADFPTVVVYTSDRLGLR